MLLSSIRRPGEGRIPWGLLSIEAVLVVLSVLLALGLNSWREGRMHEDSAQRAVLALVDEAEENCRTVEEILPYHRSVLHEDAEYEGLGVALLRNDAWTSAQSAGAAHHVEYEVASAAGAIHAHQDDHRRLVHAGIEATYYTATSQDLDLEWLRGPELPLEGPHPLMLADLERIQGELLEMYQTLFALSEEHHEVAPGDPSCGLEETEGRGSGEEVPPRSH